MSQAPATPQSGSHSYLDSIKNRGLSLWEGSKRQYVKIEAGCTLGKVALFAGLFFCFAFTSIVTVALVTSFSAAGQVFYVVFSVGAVLSLIVFILAMLKNSFPELPIFKSSKPDTLSQGIQRAGENITHAVVAEGEKLVELIDNNVQ